MLGEKWNQVEGMLPALPRTLYHSILHLKDEQLTIAPADHLVAASKHFSLSISNLTLAGGGVTAFHQWYAVNITSTLVSTVTAQPINVKFWTIEKKTPCDWRVASRMFAPRQVT